MGPITLWTEEEDILLLQLIWPSKAWNEIAARMPGRTRAACKQRYKSRFADVWDIEKKDRLARLYESHKKEMWLDIAKKMELPWAEVELCHWRLGREWMERRASDRDFLTREERLRYTPSDGLPPPPVDGDEAQALAQLQQEGISDEVWSGKEERILWECKAAGLDWTDISRRLPGRNAESCQAYYDLLVTQGGGWSPELQTELSRLYCR
ncbi:hypothetical protein E4U19_004271 [Claviceps sp. Clav32 group G5]|nr:hypothetical protein E4U19_004271 [Claviceps sp. Clav32 group G5]